jgi:hypothetical protein
MRVLSYTQPWATLVLLGEKAWETRSRRMGVKGKAGIHASKDYPRWARDLARTEPFRSVLRRHGLLPDTLPTGAVLGYAQAHETERVEDVRDRLGPQELAFGNYEDGRFCTRMSDPVPFPKPIPAKGALGFWNWVAGPQPSPGEKVWYSAVCGGCGFRCSSEYFGEDRGMDDAQAFCPLCGSTDVSEDERLAEALR